jgi:hypothetical protein
VDLGSLDTQAIGCTGACTVSNGVSGGQVTAHTHFTDNIVRVGVNYRFY